LRESDAELKQLAVNPGSAPEWIGAAHLADQVDGVYGDGLAADSARAAFPFPEQAEALSMPADDRIGLNHPKVRLLGAPPLGKPGPKGPVQRAQAWSFGGAVEHQELVTEGQVFQQQVPTAFESRHGEAKEQNQPANHAAEYARKPLRIRVFSGRMGLLPLRPVNVKAVVVAGYYP
jgi:hypothetical protein